MAHPHNSQSGQILLITLLVLSVATTIALSVIGRSTLETQSTSQLEESVRAFNAAEAGIEIALKSGVETTKTNYVDDVNYNAQIASFGNATGVYQLPAKTIRGETETIWLANHTSGALDESTQAYVNDITVCVSREAPTLPALVISVYYKQGGLYKTAYGAYDPNAGRSATNRFGSIAGTLGGCGNPNMFAKTNVLADMGFTVPIIDPTVVLLMLRIRPVYSDATIAVDTGTATLPLQGNKIVSTGTITSSGVSRRIIVNQEYRSQLSMFDGGIYSQGSFEHLPL